jgi:hypothetical protein
MKDYPLASFVEGANTALGGVFAFVAGMIGGTITADFQSYHTPETLLQCLILWPMMIVYTMAHMWGLLLFPFLAIMFYGLVWREWSRCIVIGVISIATATTWLLCKKHNPFGNFEDAITFSISMAVALGLIFIGIILIRRIDAQQAGPGRPPQGVGSPAP